MDYLLFRLYGPMASWGDIAVGESRHSFNAPTKSAIMGLVAAALGIKREEDDKHLALNCDYSMAIAVPCEGQKMKDYHTVQVPDSVGKFRYRTRRDELVLGEDRLGTVLSSREYHTDACAYIALRAESGAAYSLQSLRDALAKPVYPLYLGRKSCPVAAPLQPEVVEAENYQAALQQYAPKAISFVGRGEHFMPQLGSDKAAHWQYYWEGDICDFADESDLQQEQILSVVRHDKLTSRTRWQFAPQKIYQYRATEGQ
ncbi:type I-E CRISPR-associated protein Cas5/CasD [Oceanospirillum maris]|uniref:type I-E CRISPR-associated protein Cas5/CasD n=1 Tax=Oceanospirillum maris TaxID=64977 RepID=UPI00041A0AAB|nr:type I-E CRISPR-associated protein Cas5/CasD [Oceanospirillum maris]